MEETIYVQQTTNNKILVCQMQQEQKGFIFSCEDEDDYGSQSFNYVLPCPTETLEELFESYEVYISGMQNGESILVKGELKDSSVVFSVDEFKVEFKIKKTKLKYIGKQTDPVYTNKLYILQADYRRLDLLYENSKLLFVGYTPMFN